MNLPTSLDYFDEEELRRIPNWAAYYYALGQLASSFTREATRFVMGVAVPTRAFCAPLVALGAVTGEADERVHKSLERHFSELLKLPVGTAVTFRNKDRVLKARIEGSGRLERNGEWIDFVKVKPQKGQVQWVPLKNSHRVKLSDHKGAVRKRQIGQVVKDNSSFSKHFFSQESAEHGAIGSSNLCAVVGNRRQLTHEFREQKFLVRTSHEDDDEGTLQDVVKVKSLGKDSEQFLSEIFTPSERPQNDAAQPVAEVISRSDSDLLIDFPVVIFDGCLPFLQQHFHWAIQNQVVIFDRTDRKFDDAIEEFNRQYIRRIVDTDIIESLEFLPEAPPGVELQLFEEKRC
ncbi:MAG: hypothetical protein AAF483_06920 [Planctomycetota bacterium]